MISSICHPDLFVFYCRIDTRVVPLSVWGMYNGGTDNQQLFVNDDCVSLKENLHNVSGNTFDILSFSATTWQFFVTLSESLRCVLYWDHLMIHPKILLLDELFF